MTALFLGTEVAARINCMSFYDGFDPNAVCSRFASSAITGRILRVNLQKILKSLALAFNKAEGNFRNNVDASFAVRVIQGFISQGGIMCTQLGEKGITGPKKILEGICGFFHLYGKDKYEAPAVTKKLDEKVEMNNAIFKKY